jgi:hypothetical protein
MISKKTALSVLGSLLALLATDLLVGAGALQKLDCQKPEPSGHRPSGYRVSPISIRVKREHIERIR